MGGHLNLVGAGAGALPLKHAVEVDRRPSSRVAAAGPQPAAADPPAADPSWMLYSLVLGPAERLALIRALVGLRDSRRLDAVEERMLERLQWVEREPVAAGLHEL